MKLADWLSHHQISDAAFADDLRVSAETVRRYRHGERMPRPAIMARIMETTGGQVTANDFLMPQPVEAAE